MERNHLSNFGLVEDHPKNIPAKLFQFLIVLEFNDMSTLVSHFVSSPREREKREEIVEMKERDRKERGK